MSGASVADHLAAIVDAGSVDAAVNSDVQAGHHPFFKQKSVRRPDAPDSRTSDHLASLVNRVSLAGSATGERAEVGHHPTFKREGMRVPARGVRLAHHLAAIVDPGSLAGVATERAQVLYGDTLGGGRLEGRDSQKGESHQDAVNVVAPTAIYFACGFHLDPLPGTWPTSQSVAARAKAAAKATDRLFGYVVLMTRAPIKPN